MTNDSLVECCFTSTETVGLLGTGAQDGHLDFLTQLLSSEEEEELEKKKKKKKRQQTGESNR